MRGKPAGIRAAQSGNAVGSRVANCHEEPSIGRPKPLYIFALILALLLLLSRLAGGLACADEQSPVAPTDRAATATEGYPRLSVDVVRVVDGDTILVRLPNGATERVRYIGIDTPESVRPEQPVEPFGPEAANRNRELLQGAQVELEFDVQERDRFGRLLAYVFADGTMVNRRLVEEGLALAITYAPNVREQQGLLDAQRRARREGLGIWSPG